MLGNPTRSAPFRRKVYSISASISYSQTPGLSAPMAFRWAAAVISMALRSRRSSSRSFTSRSAAVSARRSPTRIPPPACTRDSTESRRNGVSAWPRPGAT